MDTGDAMSAPALEDGSSQRTLLSAVQLRLPPFWNRNPRVWFRQIESQFLLHRITSQSARYHHVVTSIPSELAEAVDDIQDNPPEQDAYDKLKQAILDRTMESEGSRLRQILTSEELGDRRPTQLLHKMRQLLGDRSSEAHSNLVRELFIQRLPPNIRMILASAATMPLNNLAELADRIVEHAVPTISNFATRTSLAPNPSNDSRLQELTEVVHALQLHCRDRRVSPRRSATRRRSPSANRSMRGDRDAAHESYDSLERGHCWYHRRFGASATKCTRPCTWPGNDLASR